ncbi:hypothetical protein MJM99_35460, partial [Salmonella enterica subsp. enterica serovar Kentucky]|nr:hypothetical protein [Salmonella enterica subsp. enterica serovar Kentucky]
SPCTLTMQGTGIAEVDFSSLDSSDFTPDGQSARKPLVFELTDSVSIPIPIPEAPEWLSMARIPRIPVASVPVKVTCAPLLSA